MVSGSFTPRWYYNPTHKASGRITTPTTTTGHIKSRVVAERIFTEEEARQIGNDKLATIERRIETAEISSMRNIVHTINASEELFVDNSKQLINDEFIPLSESSNHDYLSEKESINETQENFGSLEFIDSYQQEYNKNLEHYDLEYESSSERSNSASAVGVSMSTLGLLFADSDLDHVTERSRYNNDHHTISTIPTIHKRNGNNNNVPHISHDDSDNNHSIQREESHADDVNIKEEGENSEIDLANSTVNINDNHNEVKSDSKSELENVPPSESDSTEQLDSDRDSTHIEQAMNDSNDDIENKNNSENNAKTNNEDFSEFTENISGTNDNVSGMFTIFSFFPL